MTACDDTIGDESEIDLCGSSVSNKAPPASPSTSKTLLAAATTVAGSEGPDLGSTFSAIDFAALALTEEPPPTDTAPKVDILEEDRADIKAPCCVVAALVSFSCR
jgi:hypothetical protein